MDEYCSDRPEITKHANAVIYIILLSNFITALSSSVLNVAIPSIGLEFHTSPGTLGWVVSAYMIGTLALLLPIGRLADLTNKSIIMITGLAVFSIPNAFAAFSTSIEMLIVLRIFQSVGAASILSTNQALIVSAAPEEKRGRVLGMTIAGTYAGLSTGPMLGGFITHYLGWRWIFGIVAVPGIIMSAVALIWLPHKRISSEKKKFYKKLDGLGMALYITGFVTLILGINGITKGWLHIALASAGFVVLILFVVHENHTKTPLLNMDLFKGHRNFLFSNIATLLNYAATFAITYFLSIYLQIVLGYSSNIVGLILICAPIVQTFISLVTGRLSDKYSPFVLASIGMSLCATSVISFAFIVSTNGSILHIIINLTLMGIGFGMFASPNANAIMSMAPSKDRSIASSLMATMRNFGMSLSMCVITIIMNHYFGNTPIGKADIDLVSNSMHTAFLIFSVICVVGVFFSMGRRRVLTDE